MHFFTTSIARREVTWKWEGTYHIDLEKHLNDMYRLFCPWCIPYCLDKAKPPPPAGFSSAERHWPLLPFSAPEGLQIHFPKGLKARDCLQECSNQLPLFLRSELGRWIEAFLLRVPAGHQLQRMRAVYAAHGVEVTTELLERGDCGHHGGDGNGPGPGSDPPGSGKTVDWNDAWIDYRRSSKGRVAAPKEHVSNKPKEKEKVPAGKLPSQPYVLEGCERWWNNVS
ncbi:MAG: hypothetical protein M1816_000969 [Peltula sp. TS41687]|nr:MAG: hypothetical protein M1816_000969 [Peltula sp. TS41687]